MGPYGSRGAWSGEEPSGGERREGEWRREERDWRGGDEWRRGSGDEWRSRSDWPGERDRRGPADEWRREDPWREDERGREWRTREYRDAGAPHREESWREPARGQWGGDPTARWTHGESRGVYEREDRGPLQWLGEKIAGRRARGPKGYRRSDDRIRDDVCERIARSGIDADEVEVSVENAEVTLTGTVRERHEKWRLEEIAEDIFGVEDVHNQLRLGRREDTASRVDETGRVRH